MLAASLHSQIQASHLSDLFLLFFIFFFLNIPFISRAVFLFFSLCLLSLVVVSSLSLCLTLTLTLTLSLSLSLSLSPDALSFVLAAISFFVSCVCVREEVASKAYPATAIIFAARLSLASVQDVSDYIPQGSRSVPSGGLLCSVLST